MKDFGEISTQYARDVVEGRILSSRYHFLACKRHLDDLEKSKNADYPYIFNPEITDIRGKKYRPAQRICQFAELMPHIKGEWAQHRMLIRLEAWQVFCLAVPFGWVKKANFKRRFTKIDEYIPRKNAKSTLAAVIGLYCLGPDGEFGAEVYSGATSKDQAMEVFAPARMMAIMTPEYRSAYGVVPNKSNLAVVDTNSKFEPVIGNPGDGASPHCALVDEYHEHKTDELYETMATGMGARSQPLLVVITTAGSNISGPCYQHQLQLQKILEGTVEDDSRFGIIFGIDPDDDWTSEEALRKANPNFGISVSAEFLLNSLKEAINDPRKQSTFKTKHLNIWVGAANPWLNLENLQKAGDESLTLADFKGESCYVGADLASKVDIASLVYEFSRLIDGEKHYYLFSRNYIPEVALTKPENAHYRGWVEQGHLITTPGNMINLRQIEEDLVAFAETVKIEEIAMDAWGAREMQPNLQELGYTTVDIPMNVKYLSEPMKDISALNDGGRFHHDNNPAFVWMLSNVEVAPDRNDNIFPRKQRAENKIDAAVASIVSHSRAMLGEVHTKQIKQGFVAL